MRRPLLLLTVNSSSDITKTEPPASGSKCKSQSESGAGSESQSESGSGYEAESESGCESESESSHLEPSETF